MEKVKEMMEKKSSHQNPGDTIVYPQTNHTIVYLGCSWTTPLKNCLSDFFKLGFNKASYILGNWAFLRISRVFQMKETKKVIK